MGGIVLIEPGEEKEGCDYCAYYLGEAGEHGGFVWLIIGADAYRDFPVKGDIVMFLRKKERSEPMQRTEI